MNKSLLEILQTSSMFSGLTNKQIEYLVECKMMTITRFKRNEILFWTDKTPKKLYLLISGAIAMARDTPGGKRSLSKTNTIPGKLIGNVRLFSTKKMLWEYAVALEDSSVVEVDSRLFGQPGVVDTEIQMILLHNMIGDMVERIDDLGQKVRILSIGSVRERIAVYLLSIQDENGSMMLNSTREEIADYIGIARPSLSRELGRMQNEGIIRIDGREVYIVNQVRFDEIFE